MADGASDIAADGDVVGASPSAAPSAASPPNDGGPAGAGAPPPRNPYLRPPAEKRRRVAADAPPHPVHTSPVLGGRAMSMRPSTRASSRAARAAERAEILSLFEMDDEGEAGEGAANGRTRSGGNGDGASTVRDGGRPPSPLFSTFDHETGEERFPHNVSDARRAIIVATMAAVWGIQHPRPFQIFAVFCMVYLTSQLIYLIRKTGEGKSLVILTTAALLRGVTIVMVPLIGLGSDQVNKSVNLLHGVVAYHVDENRGEDFELLKALLEAMWPKDGRARSSIIRSEHRYEVFLSFNVVMNLILRIFKNGTKAVRTFEFEELFTVLRFMVLPTECYHVFLERHFERPSEDVIRSSCGDNCTFCMGDHLHFTKPFDREALVDLLMTDIFGDGKVVLSEFVKKLTAETLLIYGGDEDAVKKMKLGPGNIHALALQLVAARFVEVFVAEEKLIGSDKLNKNNLFVRLVREEGGKRWRIRNPALWEHHMFNCH